MGIGVFVELGFFKNGGLFYLAVDMIQIKKNIYMKSDFQKPRDFRKLLIQILLILPVFIHIFWICNHFDPNEIGTCRL